MPVSVRGEWMSDPCSVGNHRRCPEEFDDGGGRTKYCDCDCHRERRKEKAAGIKHIGISRGRRIPDGERTLVVPERMVVKVRKVDNGAGEQFLAEVEDDPRAWSAADSEEDAVLEALRRHLALSG